MYYSKTDIVKLYFEEKKSTTEISKLVGMSPSGVSYYLRSNGYKPRTVGEANKLAKRTFGKQRTDIDRNYVVKMYVDEKKSQHEIAKIIGLAPGAVRSLLKTRGVVFRTVQEGLDIKYPNGRRGPLSANWSGGRIGAGQKKAYIAIYSPDHPHKTKEGYVMEHRLIMEKSLGRYLTPVEVVNHINGIKNDNRIENLQLVSDRGTHTKNHFKDSFEAKRLRKLLIKNGIDPDKN